MNTWKTLKPPSRQEWMDMAIKCFERNEEWSMWLGLLLWEATKDCSDLGVCQGHQPPCVDCPQKA